MQRIKCLQNTMRGEKMSDKDFDLLMEMITDIYTVVMSLSKRFGNIELIPSKEVQALIDRNNSMQKDT